VQLKFREALCNAPALGSQLDYLPKIINNGISSAADYGVGHARYEPSSTLVDSQHRKDYPENCKNVTLNSVEKDIEDLPDSTYL